MYRCDPSTLNKQWIADVAFSVNMNLDGVKGKLLKAISENNEAATLYPIYPYFKIVFKFAEIGMTLKSKQSL